MHTLSASERQALETIEQPPMLGQVQNWAVINSGSGNLDGLATTAALLADAFSALPGCLLYTSPSPRD